MRPAPLRVLAVLAALALARASWAQHVEIVFDDVEVTVEQGALVMTPGAAGGEAAPAEGPKSARQKKLEQLAFDRRPSTILAAWSKPAEPAQPEAPPAASEPAPPPPAEAAGESTSAEPEEAPATPAAEPAEEAAPADGAGAEGGAVDKQAAREAEKAAAKARKEAEDKALDAELERFRRDVTLGRWDAVKAYLAGIDAREGKAGWRRMLASLVQGPPKKPSPFANWAEVNHFAPEDVAGLAGAAPFALEAADTTSLGQVLRQCIAAGSLAERCVARFETDLASGALAIERLDVARIFTAAEQPIEAGAFLPALDEARAGELRAALNLIARHHLALEQKEARQGHLERAWEATQAALAAGEVAEEDKQEALQRAVALAPRLREEVGQAWLDESFTARPERGMEIVAAIGAAAANGLVEKAQDADGRKKCLELQATATEALLAAAPELASAWADGLNLLAANWLREAVHSYQFDLSTQRGPLMQRDPFGNFFFINQHNAVNRNQPQPIPSGQVLAVRPSEAWLALADVALRPRIEIVAAQLLLKVNEEDEAFPIIERLAASLPERAEELAREFLRVWARNHDPNAAANRTSQYIYAYGFEARAGAVPLTRSKQERNLTELAEWVARLRRMPIEVDEKLVAAAFTAAHSTAEVYRLETIERVFGALDELDPGTLAELVQRMRANLATVWRDPAVQKEKGTRRRQLDIQSEVLRGYEVARSVVERGLERHAGDWALTLALASVLHDANAYDKEIGASAEFTPRRAQAFALFGSAAERYAAAAADLPDEKRSADAYLTWFYASLGACDLGAVDSESLLAEDQLERIRAAILALPGEGAERHMDMFASTLFARMNSVNPAVKFRYSRAGLAIAGDNDKAAEARGIFEYYRDLVTEIRLETRVDGDARVGHAEPFGLFVDIRHTLEIERESGGFAKYLVNQNAQVYAFNYGRPTEDYRDKFEQAARKALEEHFEVLSVTFNRPEAHSRAGAEYGWRVTPYAYLLLRPRGPEIDRVPALRLDLDFLDTTGYAVLPVESAPLAIDAADGEAPTRPFRELRLTQTLDERQAASGRLLLEVQATSLGLAPPPEEALELVPEGFEIVSLEDQGVSVTEFDKEGEGVEIVSQRVWTVALKAREGAAPPETFRFGSARGQVAEMVCQRFADADLEQVEPVVPLQASYGERGVRPYLAWALGAALLAGLAVTGFVVVRGARARSRRRPQGRYRMPERVSPFTVLGLLRDIETNNGVSEAERRELLEHIAELERFYFNDAGEAPPDLAAIARSWLRRVS